MNWKFWVAAITAIVLPTVLLQNWRTETALLTAANIASLVLHSTVGIVVGTTLFRRKRKSLSASPILIWDRSYTAFCALVAAVLIGGLLGLLTSRIMTIVFRGVTFLWPTYMLFGGLHSGVVGAIFGTGLGQSARRK